MTKEIWKDCCYFPQKYSVSNFGRLKNKETNHIYKLTNQYGNYFSIILTYKNQKKSIRIHRLVAKTFIPNPLNKPQVNHKDGNKQNNNVNNLEWVTRSENVKHAICLNPNIIKKMNEYNQKIKPKKIVQKSLCGKKINVFNNSVEAQKNTGVCGRNILQVANKQEGRKQAGGYKWEFLKNKGGGFGA